MAKNILNGEVSNMAFADLKDVAEDIGIKNQIVKLRYNTIKGMLGFQNISGSELAEHIGVTAQTVSSWVTNKRQPRLDELYAIAAFLECDPTELMG